MQSPDKSLIEEMELECSKKYRKLKNMLKKKMKNFLTEHTLFRNIFILHFFIEENLTLDVLFLLSHLPLFLLTFIMMDIWGLLVSSLKTRKLMTNLCIWQTMLFKKRQMIMANFKKEIKWLLKSIKNIWICSKQSKSISKNKSFQN